MINCPTPLHLVGHFYMIFHKESVTFHMTIFIEIKDPEQ